ncbi:MAG: hypothetical protein U9P42_06785 [Candidatus Fermentibacteria bacterium]|nr:hypothetical protein [Candidatus Fermentibacteria bacterium]
MKNTILALVAMSALVALVGCDPFGSDQTMTYVTGTIYTDSVMTIPAEGVAVELIVSPDSTAVRPQIAYTNVSGVFFMEIQFYPYLPDEESGAGYTMPSSATVGLTAYHGADSYVYKELDPGFILTPGDTLAVWPIHLEAFGGEQ